MNKNFVSWGSLLAIAALPGPIMADGALAAEQDRGRSARAVSADMPAVGKVDPRYQSYNVEMVEVTGGNFWAPYPKPGEAPKAQAAGPHGVEFASGSYQKRPPIDLADERLRTLAKALSPAYMRVSGSWANSIYFQDDDRPAAAPPAGYQGVLTRAQWAGVVDFSKAANAKILVSFATSAGARLPDGSWNPEQARRLFAYTKSLGGRIDAVEFMNEPNASRTPYAPEAFARDHDRMRKLVAEVSPQTIVVGPSSTGEAGFKLFPAPREEMSTARLLAGSPQPTFDVFSHHFYGAVSQRCKSLGERNNTEVTTSVADALSEAWLGRADQAQTFYKGVRDRFAPGAPIWITETAQTACGGDPWSSTFLDTFRYVDQLGRFARQGVSVLFHNTLAASDYALIDDRTGLPRPNYWAALLWRRTMGPVVLDSGENSGDLHVYAQCLPGRAGGVGLVAINLSRANPAAMTLPGAGEKYALTVDTLESRAVRMNGKLLTLTTNGSPPALAGAAVKPGEVTLAPSSVTFFTLPNARNRACS